MTFILGAVLLSAVAVVFVLLPWWRRPSAGETPATEQPELVLARTQLAELERERAAGLLDDASYAALRRRQERELLTVAARHASALRPTEADGRRWAVVALLLPLSAWLIYANVGGLADWRLQELFEARLLARARGADEGAAAQTLRDALAERLAGPVVDGDGRRRFLLARLELEAGRFDAAVAQLRALHRDFPDDATFSAQLAQALYLAANRQLSPAIVRLAQSSLASDPAQPTALGLLGIAAFETGSWAQAVGHWQRLLQTLPASTPERQLIAQGIAQARARMREAGVAGPSLEVTVDVAPELREALPADATLFVFARAVAGPPLPLAVARLQPGSWPVRVVLDDSNAMAAGMDLSSADRVQVVARLSRSGRANAAAGDLEGRSKPLEMGETALPLSIEIDRRL